MITEHMSTDPITKIFRGSRRHVGLPPGTLLYQGENHQEQLRIEVITYNEHQITEEEITEVEALSQYTDRTDTTTWINVDGIEHVESVEKICKIFGISILTMEDVVNAQQRPKAEELENYLYVTLKMMEAHADSKYVRSEQVSLILGRNFIISFQEMSGDTFQPVRERLRLGRGRIRKAGADYLMYALLDTIVDNYFVVMDNISEKLENIEDVLLDRDSVLSLDRLYRLKREMLLIRKSMWPVRELVSKLEREELKMIDAQTRIFLRDVYDHIIIVNDTIETYRDLLSGLVDLHQSVANNRMNEVMKLLTIISTIFIPLTFIAGIYGMNFENMPELRWENGYYYALGAMGVISILMVIYFKRKRWW